MAVVTCREEKDKLYNFFLTHSKHNFFLTRPPSIFRPEIKNHSNS